MTLSVKKLKALLEQRGVGYAGLVEKKELTGLVEATGVVTDDEVSDVGEGEESLPDVTNFISGYDFYEQVEDTKDSVWLVQVITSANNASFISNASWKSVRKKVAKFGVRAGVMDCSLDWKLCRKKGWYSSQVILSLPENFQTKANVVMHVYSGPAKPNIIGSFVGCIMRKDLLFYSNSRLLLAGTFLLYSTLVGYIQYKRKGGIIDEDEMDWFNFTQLQSLNPLLNPSFQIVHPGGLYAMYLLEGSDTYILDNNDFLAHFPDLVTEMQTIVSSDYIKHLPRWKYGMLQAPADSSNGTCCHDSVTKNKVHEMDHLFPCGPPDYDAPDNPVIQMMDGNYRCDCVQRNPSSSSLFSCPTGSASSQHPCPYASTSEVLYTEACCQLQNKHSSPLKTDQPETEFQTSSMEKANTDDDDCKSVKMMPDGFLEASQCVICLENFTIGAEICGLPCAHCFHEHCILPWLYRVSHACPMCRWLSYKPKPSNQMLSSLALSSSTD
ncbi:RNF103 [Acanthosepion pharaonis]|uniref:RNF103 n=1 Tax=Acanthosepion pharaonis TaxID=158019 RepID=A0A812BX02_ACAPH|nr:RNF103 [Sepia pharaonis]